MSSRPTSIPPRPRLGRRGRRVASPSPPGEPAWPAQLAAAAALGLYVALPHSLIMGPRWLVPGVEGVLLLGLSVTTPTRHRDQSPRRRGIVIGMLALVSATTLVSLALLARSLLDGGDAAGRPLILAGGILWATNVLVFGIWYWELDGGGPARRRHLGAAPPDFASPQMTKRELAPAGWRPCFVDYLYTSYTNAAAFSPTDTLPLTPRAKGLMALQSAIALTTLVLVVSRAVNILG